MTVEGRPNIQITEEFDGATAEFDGYDSIPLEQRGQLHSQKHVDIRTFNDREVGQRIDMLILGRLTMGSLDLVKMSQITADSNPPARIIVRSAEGWSNGTYGRQSDRNNWTGISLSCTTGGNPNITQSVING
jgi:hypothetical protein